MTDELQGLLAFRPMHLAWPIPHESQLKDEETALTYLRWRKQRIDESEKDPLRNGYEPAIWATVEWHINDLRRKFPQGVHKIIIWGGNRCLRGDVKIYDPVSKISRRVDDIHAPFHVYSWDGTKIVISEASIPFQKGNGKMLKVTLSNGASFCAAESHRVYTAQGWRDLSQLRVGSPLFRPRSTADIFQLVHASSAQSYAETLSNSLVDYHAGCRSRGELLQWAGADDRELLPLPVDVPRRTLIFGNTHRWLWSTEDHLRADKWDDPGKKLSHIPIGLRRDLLAIQDALILLVGRCVGILYRAFCKPCKSASALYVNQATVSASPQSADGFVQPESIPEYFPPGSQYGYDETYITSITPEGIDVKWDFTVTTGNYILGGVIHHNSSKTRFAANYVNRDSARKEGERRWWCCDSTEAMSRANQMRLIYEQFPPEWKNLARDNVTDVRYSLSDGFSKNKLVCPNRSEIDFKFYSMDIANLPGPELDGIWADELVPLVWVETLVYRLVNRNGLLLITFTPELGWNDTIGFFHEGSQVLEETDAPLLPKFNEAGQQIGFEKVPRIAQCADPTARIIYFHTSDNPFGNYPSLVQQLKTKSREEILIRAYGVAAKSHSVAFPMFSRRVHVITQAQLDAFNFKSPDKFHLVDPCDGRMWFMIWVLCPSPNKWIIYREFPSYGHTKAYIQGVGMPGPWAVSGSAADGVRGGGQDTRGFALDRYRDEILHQEDGETILARYIDSRYSTSPKSGETQVTTLLEQMGQVGMDFLTMVPGKGKIIALEHNDGSVDMINSALYYDATIELGAWNRHASRLNSPDLLVLDTCPNVIYALEHWTGQDGQKGACKDPIDCIRGMFLSNVNYCGEDMYAFKGGGIPR